MACTLSGLVNGLFDGSKVKDPIGQVNESLNTAMSDLAAVNTTPEFIAFKASVEGLQTSIGSAVTGVTSRIGTLLPFAKAADGLEKKLLAMDGTTPADGPTPSFSGIVGPLNIGKEELDKFNADVAAAQADIAAGGAAATAKIAELNAKIATATGTVSTAVSGATTAFNDSVGKIKAYAQAKFASSNQPEFVKEITALTTTCQPTPIVAKMESMAARQLTQQNSTENSGPEIVSVRTAALFKSKPVFSNVSNTPVAGVIGGYANFELFKQAFFTYVEGLTQAKEMKETEYLQARMDLDAWKDTNVPNWKELVDKNTSPNTPTAEERTQYLQLISSSKDSEEGVALNIAFEEVNLARQTLANSLQLWNNYASSGFSTSVVESGPPWNGPNLA